MNKEEYELLEFASKSMAIRMPVAAKAFAAAESLRKLGYFKLHYTIHYGDDANYYNITDTGVEALKADKKS